MARREEDEHDDIAASGHADVARRAKAKGPVTTTWGEPWTAEEWDAHFPGILDGIGGLTGAANIIMQLGRPGVGYGVVESRVHEGNVFRHPWKRARTTFSFLAIAMLGTTEEKLLYRQAVNRSHRQVHSTADSPVKYHAMDPDLQLWVAACLFFGVCDTMQRFRGPLSPEQLEELYRRCQTFGTTLQVRESMWPADYQGFLAYFERELDAIHIDDTVRAYLDSLVALKMMPRPVQWAASPTIRFFTTGFLPPQFREAMHYTWSDDHQRVFDVVVRTLGRANAVVPRVVRQAGTIVLMRDLRDRMKRGAALV